MPLNALRAEALKLRRSSFWLPVVIAPALAIGSGGLFAAHGGRIATAQAWLAMYQTTAYVYALLFLPLAVCATAALVCQVEHAAGGWKQLGALPVPRVTVYLVKFAAVMAAIALMQALLVAAVRLDGLIDHATLAMPWPSVAASALGGWAACAPLAALQLWVGTLWASFGAQFAVSTILTVPGSIAIHRLSYAMWYPWSQPAMVMFGQAQGAETPGIVVASLLVFLLVGALHFAYRDVAA